MTPFKKDELHKIPEKLIARDNYNFFISQLRIRIEMAFGQLVGKWRILKNPLQCRIKKCPKVIHTCIRLHNFIINDKMSNNIDILEEDETSPIIDCFNENTHTLTDR